MDVINQESTLDDKENQTSENNTNPNNEEADRSQDVQSSGPSDNHNINPDEFLGLRDDLIKTAVDFLMIPKVVSSSMEKKKAFLRSKGLTDDEIQVAFTRARGNNYPTNDNGSNISSHQFAANILESPHRSVESSTWSPFTRFTFSAAIVSGLCYGGYQIYKRYVQPAILKYFGERLDSIESKLDNVTDAVKKLENENHGEKLQRDIESILIKASRPNTAEIHAINELKNEISSVKALLLSKNSFPSPSVSDGSIPSWQKSDGEIIKNGVSDKKSSIVTNGDSS